MTQDLTEWMVRSSVLLSVLVPAVWFTSAGLRRLLGARVGYAAWLLVLPAVVPRLPLPAAIEVISPSSPLPIITLSTMRSVPAGGETQTFNSLLLLVWLTGAAIAAIAFARRQRRFRRQLHSDIGASKPTAAPRQRLRAMGMPRWVPVRSSRAIATPLVAGCMPPTLYLPDGCYQEDAVLAHEIAHIRHGDPWWSLLAAVLRSLFWFLPWMYPAWKAFRKNQELAADEAVLCHLDRAQRYHYGCLLAATAGIGEVPAGQPWCGHSLLKERISMITRNPPTKAMLRAGATLIVASVLAMTWALALGGHDEIDDRPIDAQVPPEAVEELKRLAGSEPLTGEALDPLVRHQPEYPRQAAVDRVTGHVKLEAVLTETGDVTAIRVIEAEPEGVFEAVAVEAFSHWKFVPVRSQETGEPMPVKIRQTIDFVMD